MSNELFQPLEYEVETNVFGNGNIEQLLREKPNISSPAERVSCWICQTRDLQVKEALEKLGFMYWKSTKESLPHIDETVLFIYRSSSNEELTGFGKMQKDQSWIDLACRNYEGIPQIISFKNVLWWCRLSCPWKNNE